MNGYKLKRNMALWIVAVVLMVNGNLINALAGNGTTGQKVTAQNKNTAEVSTLFVQGTLVSISSDAYVIRNVDDQEFTVIVTKETGIKETPRVGDHLEVEYLENGKALVVIVKHSKK